jgi:hypothetical protein
LKGRVGKRKEARSRKALVNDETLHEALENSILGNPIDQNTL